MVITILTLLISLLLRNHEPPSRFLFWRPGRNPAVSKMLQRVRAAGPSFRSLGTMVLSCLAPSGSSHGRAPRTSLEFYAAEVQRNAEAHAFSFGGSFAMYTVPLKDLLDMQAVRCHEELLAEGLLVAYDRHLGTAIFISHQWRSRNHPDPDARQLRVLQTALQNLLSGKTSISAPIIHEIVFGSVHTPTAAELSATPLFVWYDYFSCPQDEGDKAVADRMSAINSIPSYVGRCQTLNPKP